MRPRWTGWTVAMAAAWMMACSGNPTAVEIDRLEGSWAWESASGGIAGRTVTPATQGYTMEVRFLAGGKAELYRNDTLTTSANFRLDLGEKGGSFVGRDVVRFDQSLLGGWEEMGVELTGSSLLLVDGCCDGYAYSFHRIAGS